MGKRRCSMAGCHSAESKPGVHLFSFPVHDPDRCHQWIRRSENPHLEYLSASSLKRKAICQKHFPTMDFTSLKKVRLVPTACPIYAAGANVDEFRHLTPKTEHPGSSLQSVMSAIKSHRSKQFGEDVAVAPAAECPSTSAERTSDSSSSQSSDSWLAIRSTKKKVRRSGVKKVRSYSARAPPLTAVSRGKVSSTKVCRTCLSPQVLTPLFARPAQHSSYEATLLLSTGIQMSMDDGLPQFICKICRQLINSFILFRFQSQSAEEHLRDFNRRMEITPEEADSLFNDIILPSPDEIKKEANAKFDEFQLNNQDTTSILKTFERVEKSRRELPKVAANVDEQDYLSSEEDVCVKVEPIVVSSFNVKVEKFDSGDDVDVPDVPIGPADVNCRDVKPSIKQEKLEVEDTEITPTESAVKNEVEALPMNKQRLLNFRLDEDNGRELPKFSYSRKRKSNFDGGG